MWATGRAWLATTRALITVLGLLRAVGTAFGATWRTLLTFTTMHHGWAGARVGASRTGFMTEVLAARALMVL